MRGELALTTELHASLLRPLSAFTGSSEDQVALKLRQSSQYCEHQSAVWSGRVGPTITKRFEAGPGLADCVESVEQIAS